MKQLKIKSKTFIIIGISFIIVAFTVFLSLLSEHKANQNALIILEENIRDNYDDFIKAEIHTALSMIDSLHKKYKEENFSTEEAKVLIAEVIRQIRYGDDGYFWIDTSNGDNVVLYGSDVEGSNRFDYQDTSGKYVVQEAINKAVQGGGFFDYYFPREGANISQPKRAYSSYYQEFDWVIGTGIYTDNIDNIIKVKANEQSELINERIDLHIIFLLVFYLIILSINSFMTKNIVDPLLYASSYAESISNEEYKIKMPREYLNREDEVGKLLNSLKKMHKSILNIMSDKEEINQILSKEKEFLRIILSSIGDGIIVIDKDGIVRVINDSTLVELEIKDEDIIHKKLIEEFKFFDRNNIELKEINNLNDYIVGKSEIRRECYLEAFDKRIYIEESIFPIYNLDDLEGFVYVFRNISDRLKKQKEIEYLNYNDQLTGLYNRRFFEKATYNILKEKRFPLTLIIADINALKLTNDAFGHLMGDKLIKEFSSVLSKHFSDIGLVARIGGDEFAVLITNVDIDIVTEKVETIKNVLLNKKVKNIPVSAAFGVAVHTEKKKSFSTTFNLADERMYENKLFDNDKIKNRILKSIIRYNYELFPEKKVETQRAIHLIKDFSKKLGLSQDVTIKLKKSALLYDIGNKNLSYDYFVEDKVLNNDEVNEIRTHPSIGYHILKNINKYEEIANIILNHHENFDGSGYPRGIKANKIPYESRILALVTDYCAMTSNRTYRKALTKEEAVKQMYDNIGKRYDPELIDEFVEFIMSV
ncbi:MAG TPA: diguanylate cyclase [Clostridiales bacterium]|nr:diguanylate cyclase [Clostridiales bacterium]